MTARQSTTTWPVSSGCPARPDRPTSSWTHPSCARTCYRSGPEEWLIGTREWFRQVRLHALEALCDRYRDDGRFAAALDAGITAVAADPLRESAHRKLALLHIEEGNSAEALRQYDVFRKLLRTELGLPPPPHFRRLIAPLLGRPLDGMAAP